MNPSSHHTLSKQLFFGRGVELLEAVCERNAIAYRTDGTHLIFALRPEDKNPSCKAELSRDGGWKDFGTDETGDAFTLIAKLHNLDARRDFTRILELAAGFLGIPIPKGGNVAGSGTKKSSKCDKEFQIVTLDPEPTLDQLVAQYGLQKVDFKEAGIGIENAFFREAGANLRALIYPITLPDGRVTFKAKSLQRTQGKGSRLVTATPGVSFNKGLFGDPARAAGKTLVVVGGEEKRLAVEKAGYIAVSGANGEKKLAVETLEWIVRCAPKEIVIAFDADDAGFKGTRALSAQITGAKDYKGGLRIVTWPPGTPDKYDINDVLKAAGYEGLRHLIDTAPAYVEAEFPDDLLCTDIGNGLRFVERHGEDVAYDAARGVWLYYNGKRWAEDIGAAYVQRLMQKIPQAILKEAGEKGGRNLEVLTKWAVKSAMAPRLKAGLDQAKVDVSIVALPSEFDTDHNLLNIQNGTVDLQTGELRPHRQSDKITKIGNVYHDPNAECPTWKAFLHRILGGNEDLIAFLQRAVGYAMTGQTSEQCFFLLYGTGSNGKTTFVETLCYILGTYAKSADPQTFLADERGGATGGQARPDLVALVGKRFVIATEVDKDKRFAEAIVKALTGQDTRLIRDLYGTAFDWIPTMKLFMAVNHKPTIKGADEGIWRRIHMIPFTVTIPDEEKDQKLPAKLREEAPGILNWAIAGARAWFHSSLKPPAAVREATKEYREESDLLSGYLGECCIIGRNCQESTANLYAAYEKWCEAAGETYMKVRTFGKNLRERGFKDWKSGSVRGWAGLRLRQDGEQAQQDQPRVVQPEKSPDLFETTQQTPNWDAKDMRDTEKVKSPSRAQEIKNLPNSESHVSDVSQNDEPPPFDYTTQTDPGFTEDPDAQYERLEREAMQDD
jgi:putative DNA primase/helicase